MRKAIGKKIIRLLLRIIVRPLRSRFIRRFLLAGVDPGVIVINEEVVPFGSIKTSSATTGRTLNIVAHEDDDLLFLSPDLLHAIQSGRTVGTIFLCAGDAGKGTAYWKGREAGARAAYAQMCGVANSWTQTDAGISEHPIPIFRLAERPSVFLAFLRIPDGNFDGSGFLNTGSQSLQKLWTGVLSTIHVLDGSSSYTKESLSSVLSSLIASFQPDQVNMQDYVGTFGDGDHSDHHATAYFVQSALQEYKMPYSFTGYDDYHTASLPANVIGADLAAKQKAFFVYAQNDECVCANRVACAGSDYGLWLKRQYTVGSGSNVLSEAMLTRESIS